MVLTSLCGEWMTQRVEYLMNLHSEHLPSCVLSTLGIYPSRYISIPNPVTLNLMRKPNSWQIHAWNSPILHSDIAVIGILPYRDRSLFWKKTVNAYLTNQGLYIFELVMDLPSPTTAWSMTKRKWRITLKCVLSEYRYLHHLLISRFITAMNLET